MAFKIALTAGHYLYTAGKRCLKSLDPNETREWVLNDRIVTKVTQLLQGYTGYELLRTDDPTGKKNVTLTARTDAANAFGADIYLSIHHNAGIGGGSGGGIVSIVHTKADSESKQWQKDLYDALIEATGLQGNRAEPLAKMNLHEVREPGMPAVLLELGFMDSRTDVPVILTEEYADQCAAAIVKVLAGRGGLQRKEECTLTLPVLTAGADGAQVRVMQQLLEANGCKGEMDESKYGSFGSKTQAAVKLYQRKSGLPVTGSCDCATWARLLEVDA